MHENGKGLDAFVAGCRQCPNGYADSPDDTGETTMDAMIMNPWVGLLMLHLNSLSFCVSNGFCTRLQLNNL